MLAISPGARVVIRDEEWLVRRVDPSNDGGWLLTCDGVSELVRSREALFLTQLEDHIEVLDPAATRLVADPSPTYNASMLYLESMRRRSVANDERIHLGHRGVMNLVPYQLDPALQALRQPLLDAERGYVLAPMRQGLRLTTGAEFAALDAPPTPLQLPKAERCARELLDFGPALDTTPWLGARPCTVDMLPLVGAAPRHRGLWVHFGHGHQGFTLGPVTGRLLAEIMSRETPFTDPVPYSPQRCWA